MDQKNHSAIKKSVYVGVCPAAAALDSAGSSKEGRADILWGAAVPGSCTGLVYQRVGQGSWQGVLVAHGTRDRGLVLSQD